MLSNNVEQKNTQKHFKIAFAKRLTAALDKKGLSQTDLAKMMGLSRATISRWVSEYPNISSKKLAELSSLLNISLNWLLLGVHSPDKPVLFELSCDEQQLLLLLNDMESDLRDHFIQMIKPLESKLSNTLNKHHLQSSALIKANKLPVVINDFEGKIIYSNEHHDEYVGATAAGISLVNRSIFEIVPNFFHGPVKFDMQKVKYKGYSGSFKCTGKRLDTGAPLHFTIYARLIETAEDAAMFSILFPKA